MKYERITDKEHRFKKCAGCTYKKCQYCDDKPDYEREGYNRLAELEDKIEQGKLLELACKKGDKVYQADCVRIYELTVLGIRVFNNKFYYETQGVGFDNTAIGKSIFLTREEAEKRLKEIQE